MGSLAREGETEEREVVFDELEDIRNEILALNSELNYERMDEDN